MVKLFGVTIGMASPSRSLDHHSTSHNSAVLESKVLDSGLARTTTGNKIVEIDGKKTGVLPPTKLFIGKIYKEWSADKFEKIVRQAFSDVASVDFGSPINSGDAHQKLKNRGFGNVKFSSPAAAAQAHSVGTAPGFILGSTCRPVVKWADLEYEIDPEELAKVKKACVRNAPPDVDEKYLETLFQPFGMVEEVVILKRRQFPLVYVSFFNRSDLDKAVKGMNGKSVKGPNGGASFSLLVEVARPFEKSKKRTRDDFQIQQPSKMPTLTALSKEEPDITSPVDSLVSRANLPPVESLSSHMETSLSRYDNYTDPYASIADSYASRYTPQSLSNRLGFGRMDEGSPTSLHQTAVSSSSYSRIGLYPPPVTQVLDRQPTRPRIRFDPYTGEPYKFDPFTGEPIVPESLSRHSPRQF